MRSMYCAHCGTVAEPVTYTKGSLGIEILLWLLMILPGVLYTVWRLTTKYRGCPTCGAAIMLPLDAPNAVAALKDRPPMTWTPAPAPPLKINTRYALYGVAALVVLALFNLFVR